ncbi:MAG TPA: SRPBCC family protein [Thermodesulfobacteriota bacterium]|nr:SRPBCC family protein [Thermodesulfobacteriota bacterium]
MKLHQLRRIQRLPVSIETAWDFFSNPKNLPLITPSSLALKITSELPEKMYPGMLITYNVSPIWGIPVTWVTEITHIAEPHLFVDEQRFGPYTFWHHKHFFKKIEGGVEVLDIVHYALPLGILGRFVNRLLVRSELEKIFTYRSQILEDLFGNLSG